MAALDPEFGDVPVELLVRFGRLAVELRIEAENLGADLIGLATPSRPGPRHQLRAWLSGRHAVCAGGPVLPLVPDEAADRPCESGALPAFR